jgi:plastocyanin
MTRNLKLYKMKKLLITLFIFSATTLGYGKVWTVVNSSFAFSPATLTINVGDSVLFTLATIHNAVEVSQTSWTANSPTALPGGFATPLGGGLVPASQLTLGTHWYVCTVHVATMGMKGTIIVQTPTGISLAQSFIDKISVYPNPARSIIHLNLSEPQNAMLKIINLAGQLIIERQIENGENIIDATKLPEGMYIVMVISNKKQIYNGKLNIVK